MFRPFSLISRCFLGAFLLLSSVLVAEGGLEAGRVLSAHGKAWVINGETRARRVANVGDSFNVGDTLQTGDKSYMQVQFQDETLIELIGESDLEVELALFKPEKNIARMNLKSNEGSFRFTGGRISDIAPGNFRMKTANATIGIQGSEGVLKVNKRWTAAQGSGISVSANKGTGQMTGQAGNGYVLSPGLGGKPTALLGSVDPVIRVSPEGVSVSEAGEGDLLVSIDAQLSSLGVETSWVVPRAKITPVMQSITRVIEEARQEQGKKAGEPVDLTPAVAVKVQREVSLTLVKGNKQAERVIEEVSQKTEEALSKEGADASEIIQQSDKLIASAVESAQADETVKEVNEVVETTPLDTLTKQKIVETTTKLATEAKTQLQEDIQEFNSSLESLEVEPILEVDNTSSQEEPEPVEVVEVVDPEDNAATETDTENQLSAAPSTADVTERLKDLDSQYGLKGIGSRLASDEGIDSFDAYIVYNLDNAKSLIEDVKYSPSSPEGAQAAIIYPNYNAEGAIDNYSILTVEDAVGSTSLGDYVHVKANDNKGAALHFVGGVVNDPSTATYRRDYESSSFANGTSQNFLSGGEFSQLNHHIGLLSDPTETRSRIAVDVVNGEGVYIGGSFFDEELLDLAGLTSPFTRDDGTLNPEYWGTGVRLLSGRGKNVTAFFGDIQDGQVVVREGGSGFNLFVPQGIIGDSFFNVTDIENISLTSSVGQSSGFYGSTENGAPETLAINAFFDVSKDATSTDLVDGMMTTATTRVSETPLLGVLEAPSAPPFDVGADYVFSFTGPLVQSGTKIAGPGFGIGKISFPDTDSGIPTLNMGFVGIDATPFLDDTAVAVVERVAELTDVNSAGTDRENFIFAFGNNQEGLTPSDLFPYGSSVTSTILRPFGSLLTEENSAVNSEDSFLRATRSFQVYDPGTGTLRNAPDSLIMGEINIVGDASGTPSFNLPGMHSRFVGGRYQELLPADFGFERNYTDFVSLFESLPLYANSEIRLSLFVGAPQEAVFTKLTPTELSAKLREMEKIVGDAAATAKVSLTGNPDISSIEGPLVSIFAYLKGETSTSSSEIIIKNGQGEVYPEDQQPDRYEFREAESYAVTVTPTDTGVDSFTFSDIESPKTARKLIRMLGGLSQDKIRMSIYPYQEGVEIERDEPVVPRRVYDDYIATYASESITVDTRFEERPPYIAMGSFDQGVSTIGTITGESQVDSHGLFGVRIEQDELGLRHVSSLSRTAEGDVSFFRGIYAPENPVFHFETEGESLIPVPGVKVQTGSMALTTRSFEEGEVYKNWVNLMPIGKDHYLGDADGVSLTSFPLYHPEQSLEGGGVENASLDIGSGNKILNMVAAGAAIHPLDNQDEVGALSLAGTASGFSVSGSTVTMIGQSFQPIDPVNLTEIENVSSPIFRAQGDTEITPVIKGLGISRDEDVKSAYHMALKDSTLPESVTVSYYTRLPDLKTEGEGINIDRFVDVETYEKFSSRLTGGMNRVKVSIDGDFAFNEESLPTQLHSLPITFGVHPTDSSVEPDTYPMVHDQAYTFSSVELTDAFGHQFLPEMPVAEIEGKLGDFVLGSNLSISGSRDLDVGLFSQIDFFPQVGMGIGEMQEALSSMRLLKAKYPGYIAASGSVGEFLPGLEESFTKLLPQYSVSIKSPGDSDYKLVDDLSNIASGELFHALSIAQKAATDEEITIIAIASEGLGDWAIKGKMGDLQAFMQATDPSSSGVAGVTVLNPKGEVTSITTVNALESEAYISEYQVESSPEVMARLEYPPHYHDATEVVGFFDGVSNLSDTGTEISIQRNAEDYKTGLTAASLDLPLLSEENPYNFQLTSKLEPDSVRYRVYGVNTSDEPVIFDEHGNPQPLDYDGIVDLTPTQATALASSLSSTDLKRAVVYQTQGGKLFDTSILNPVGNLYALYNPDLQKVATASDIDLASMVSAISDSGASSSSYSLVSVYEYGFTGGDGDEFFYGATADQIAFDLELVSKRLSAEDPIVTLTITEALEKTATGTISSLEAFLKEEDSSGVTLEGEATLRDFLDNRFTVSADSKTSEEMDDYNFYNYSKLATKISDNEIKNLVISNGEESSINGLHVVGAVVDSQKEIYNDLGSLAAYVEGHASDFPSGLAVGYLDMPSSFTGDNFASFLQLELKLIGLVGSLSGSFDEYTANFFRANGDAILEKIDGDEAAQLQAVKGKTLKEIQTAITNSTVDDSVAVEVLFSFDALEGQSLRLIKGEQSAVLAGLERFIALEQAIQKNPGLIQVALEGVGLEEIAAGDFDAILSAATENDSLYQVQAPLPLLGRSFITKSALEAMNNSVEPYVIRSENFGPILKANTLKDLLEAFKTLPTLTPSIHYKDVVVSSEAAKEALITKISAGESSIDFTESVDPQWVSKDFFFLPSTVNLSGVANLPREEFGDNIVLQALPGLEQMEGLSWGIWETKQTDSSDAAFGFFALGARENLSTIDSLRELRERLGANSDTGLFETNPGDLVFGGPAAGLMLSKDEAASLPEIFAGSSSFTLNPSTLALKGEIDLAGVSTDSTLKLEMKKSQLASSGHYVLGAGEVSVTSYNDQSVTTNEGSYTGAFYDQTGEPMKQFAGTYGADFTTGEDQSYLLHGGFATEREDLPAPQETPTVVYGP